MAHKIIIVVLGSLTVFNILLHYIIGLAAYSINIRTRVFKVSNWLLTYNIIMGMTIVYIFPGNVIKLFKQLNGVVITNVPTVASIVTKFIEYMTLILVYFLQIKNRHTFVKHMNNVIKFNKTYEYNVNNPNNYSIIDRDVAFLPYLVAIFIKLLIDFSIILARALCYHYLIINKVDNYYFLLLIDMMPTIVILFSLNVFIFSMLQSHFIFKQINIQTKMLLRDVGNIRSRYQNNTIKYFEYQRKLCDLSDRLDVIAMCHSELCGLVRKLNKFYSAHLLLIIVIGFMDIILQLFFQYVMISYSYLGVQSFPTKLAAVGVVIVLLALCNILNIVYISSKLMKESRRTGQIIHNVEPCGLDVRMKQSIEMFSLHLEQNRLFIHAWRLFIVNNSIVYSIVGAATSYLIILIQFDLASTKIRVSIN